MGWGAVWGALIHGDVQRTGVLEGVLRARHRSVDRGKRCPRGPCRVGAVGAAASNHVPWRREVRDRVRPEGGGQSMTKGRLL